jgi:hypothetical protein
MDDLAPQNTPRIRGEDLSFLDRQAAKIPIGPSATCSHKADLRRLEGGPS